MLRQTYAVTVVLLVLLVRLCSFAQDDVNASSKTSGSDPLPTVSNDALAANGFSFADASRPMCNISGPEGDCRVEAFVFGELRVDEAAFTCAKLDKSTYVGRCVKGKLDGLSLVIADGSKKNVKEAFLSYFKDGRMAYPALTSFLAGNLNVGVTEIGKSYGCVYFGKWDKSVERCAFFQKIYGTDLFTETNAQSLRDGTFDL